MRRLSIVRTLRHWGGYLWASPNSLLGLFLGVAGRIAGGRWKIVRGVLEVEGPLLAWLLRSATPATHAVEALTLGHVVLGRDSACLARCREHEWVHVRQYERLGPLFLPVYVLASAWAWGRGGCAYRDNFLEHEAYKHAPINEDACRGEHGPTIDLTLQ